MAMGVILIGLSHEAVAETRCGIESLSGTYIISAMGIDGEKFSAYAGMIVYDGKGGYRIRIRYVGPSQETKEDRGNYSVVGPCEIEATSQSGRSAHYFIDPSGNTFRYVMMSGSSVVGDAKRVSREFLFE